MPFDSTNGKHDSRAVRRENRSCACARHGIRSQVHVEPDQRPSLRDASNATSRSQLRLRAKANTPATTHATLVLRGSEGVGRRPQLRPHGRGWRDSPGRSAPRQYLADASARIPIAGTGAAAFRIGAASSAGSAVKLDRPSQHVGQRVRPSSRHRMDAGPASISNRTQPNAQYVMLVSPRPARAPARGSCRPPCRGSFRVVSSPVRALGQRPPSPATPAATGSAAFASPKSSTFTVPSGPHLDVRRLEIAMDDSALVGCLERFGHLLRDPATASSKQNPRPVRCVRPASGPPTSSITRAVCPSPPRSSP